MDSHGTAGVLVMILMLAAMPPAQAAELPSVCCQVSMGIGGTYHYWAQTGGIVVPLTVAWSAGRYELGVFRMATAQSLETAGMPPAHRVADPYWGFSASRRWRLFGPASVPVFVGLGISYKTEHDGLVSTRWNFAEQLGVQFRFKGGTSAVELCVRHWSNAGLRLPNRGQDFITLTYAF